MSEPSNQSASPQLDGPRPRLTRVRLRNFKSIRSCDVDLGALTVLIGRNGSGKSNFVDALEFAAEAWNGRLTHAVRARGGMNAVFTRVVSEVIAQLSPPPPALEIGVGALAPIVGGNGFLFRIEQSSRGRWSVTREARPHFGTDERTLAWDGSWHGEEWTSVIPEVPTQELRLRREKLEPIGLGAADLFYAASHLSDALFLRPNLALIRAPQSIGAGERLADDGSNLASVIDSLFKEVPHVLERITQYMRGILPELVEIRTTSLAEHIALEFVLRTSANQESTFHGPNLSDGTLLALCALTAAFAPRVGDASTCLVVLEEPERGLHPAGATVLMDALVEASRTNQIIVTTHSSELIERLPVDRSTLLVVAMRDGETIIAPPDAAARKMLDEQLYTAGELQRMDQFEPDMTLHDRPVDPS